MAYHISWETPEDHAGVLELLGAAFPEPPEFFTDIMSKDPWYHYCKRRIIKLEGKIISNVDLFTRNVWVAGKPILVGDLGNVSTHQAYRRKGYCSAIVNDLVGYMAENGYGLSTIYAGAPEFYESLKWRLFPEKRAIIKIGDEIKAPNNLYSREINDIDDLPDVIQFFGKFGNRNTDATVRSRDYWHKHFQWLKNPPCFLVAVQNYKEIIGFTRYCIIKDTAFIKEIAHIKEPGYFQDFFAQILNRIYSNGIKNISIGYFTPDHSINSLRIGNVKVEIHDNSTLRMRLINLKSLFTAMLPKFRENLMSISNSHYENSISLKCEVGGVTLFIRQDNIHITDIMPNSRDVFLPQIDLIRLILGCVSFQEIQLEEGKDLSKQDFAVLNALFPESKPLYWQADHF